MKKYIVLLLLLIPFIKVKALSCYIENEEINVDEVSNFSCSDVYGDSLSFKSSGKDYKEYFTYKIESGGSATVSIKKEIRFDKSFKRGLVVITDGEGHQGIILVKNKDYVEPTTTKDPTVKEISVTLDPNNGSEKVVKTCKITSGNTTCSVVLPKLNDENFNGWGTAKGCKDGNTGSIKVEEDVSYYACYKDNKSTTTTTTTTKSSKSSTTTTKSEDEEETTTVKVYLDSLSITDKDSGDDIDFGTFSRRNNKYEFKVLNETENLNIKYEVADDITVEVTGNESLEEGENEIVIKLTDKDNNTSEYTLLVNRLKEGETINSIHYLKSLVIGGYNIEFNKEVFNYSVKIKGDIDALEIDAVPEVDTDTYDIEGNNNLIDGSKVSIVVYDEEDEENSTTYTVNITKEKSMDIIMILTIVLIVVLVVLIIIAIILKTKKTKGKGKVEPEKPLNSEIEVLNI